MKKFSDRQKYLIILLYHFLKDVEELGLEELLHSIDPTLEIGICPDSIHYPFPMQQLEREFHPWKIKITHCGGRGGIICYLDCFLDKKMLQEIIYHCKDMIKKGKNAETITEKKSM